MGLKTYDKWPDGSTTIDKVHWTSGDDYCIEQEKASQEDNQTPPVEDGDNLGLKIALRPIKQFTILRAEFPSEIVDELNSHIETVTIPKNKDYSRGLVGQLKNDDRSAQLDFSLTDDIGKTVKIILDQCGTTYLKTGCERNATADVTQAWVNRAYAGDYNPYHDHGGVTTSAGLSGFVWLKVPECIEKLDAFVPKFNNAGGGIDGFTHLVWGTTTLRDVQQLRPITEDYIKPEVGTMIIFPNWLKHAVLPFYGEGERRSIAFNWEVNDAK